MSEVLPALDVDDTIFMGSTPIYEYCYHESLKTVGIDLRGLQLRKATDPNWGSSHRTQLTYIINFISGHYNLENKVNKADKEFFKVLGNVMVNSVGILPGTKHALESLPNPALATGLHPEILAKIFDRFKIDIGIFDPIITSYDLEPGQEKPNPFMIDEIIRLRNQKNANDHEYKAEEVVMVGDSENDMVMAHRAHARCIAVLTGRLTRYAAIEMQDGSIKIDSIVNDIREVPDAIEKII